MGIVNKRNAIVGWVALKVGKRVLRKKAQGAAAGGKRAGRGAARGVLAAVGGVLLFLRSKRGSASNE